jgi:hypothetical protein
MEQVTGKICTFNAARLPGQITRPRALRTNVMGYLYLSRLGLNLLRKVRILDLKNNSNEKD